MKHEEVCRVWNYIENSLIAIYACTGYVPISIFASLVWIPIGIASSRIGFRIWAITAKIKKCKSIIKKKRKKHNKIVLLAKTKLNNIEVLISKALIDWNISHDEFVLTNNVLKEFYDMKKKSKILMINKLYIKQCYLIVWSVEKIQKAKILKL